MPQPNAPPTPGSSSDLRGKEGALAAPAFHLPPTAFQDVDRASTSSATPSANGSDSSYRPVSPTSPADSSRKRPAPQSSSGSVVTKDDFALPPPPTRSRKIIQMKPRQSNEQEDHAPQTTTTSPQTAAKSSQAGGKKGRNTSNTTAAGRKIARKTAHSLIERRRRSKMNEEFGVLKDMIPACKGQEMHKLAILQASIDYLRYLERCVADLQAQNNSPQPKPASTSQRASAHAADENEEDSDEEMEDGASVEAEENSTTASTPATNPQDRSGSLVSLPSLSQITTTTTNTTSPSAFSANGRHYSISSASQPSFSPYFHSTQTSPAFGPQLSTGPTLPPPYASSSREAFGLGSPAMRPLDSSSQQRKVPEVGSLEMPEAKQRRLLTKVGNSEQDLDHEATAALLMLNHDRRVWRGAKGDREASGRSGTGMSVKDLLSG